MDAGLKDSLTRRVARLRLQVGRTMEDARDTTEQARVVSAAASQARRRRWTARYEQALERKHDELGDLSLDD